MVIGITGNSGSGKTMISNLLKDKYNANIINADEVVHKLSAPGNIYYNEIVKEFGENIIFENGKINKTKLANLIFNNSKKRNQLNDITFKYVVEDIKKQVNSSNSNVNIIDAPLLIEGKLDKVCDIVISVLADEKTKLKRICMRDNINEKIAIERINAQPNDDFYIKNSNLVIVNNDGYDIEKQIDGIIEMLESNMINAEESVIIQDRNLKILQFKKLLEYNNYLVHAFTLKPFNFGSNDTYKNLKEEVNANYNSACELLGLDSKDIVRSYQTHTKNIKEVKNEIGIFNKEFTDVDGLVTDRKNRVLSLVFADCMPIYLFDRNKKIIGNIHSGWQGTTKMISKESIKFMKQKYNCRAEDIICIIGPTIRKCHFEVKEDVKDLFYDTFKYMNNIDDIITYNEVNDSYYIDTVEINKKLLKEEGILPENIIDSGICSVCNSNIIHSFRKEGKNAGRGTSIISLI